MMKFNFSFNLNTHDFWEIYESIRRFYPIGLRQHEGKGIYYQYPGVKELEKIVVENIHIRENYNDRWIDFTNQIGEEFKKEIIGTTYGQAPSFSSSILLEKNQFETCTHYKELHFAVSLVGKFFQIYGIDRTVLKQKMAYSSVSVITTSPFEEFKEPFLILEDKLRKRFTGYKMIPFFYGKLIIDGLQVRYLDEENCSINQALFNNSLNEKNFSKSIRGEKYYGSEDWIKK